ncbi:hypothetical protein IKI14_06045 [bacterium]|nr:hypothetical protein [bacterium]
MDASGSAVKWCDDCELEILSSGNVSDRTYCERRQLMSQEILECKHTYT